MKSAVKNIGLNRHSTTDPRGPGISQISKWLEDSSILFFFVCLFIYSYEL